MQHWNSITNYGMNTVITVQPYMQVTVNIMEKIANGSIFLMMLSTHVVLSALPAPK